MDEKEDKKMPTPPYVSFKTFLNLIQRLKTSGIPARIDRSVLGFYSGSAQAQVLTALKYLHLTSDHGIPTDKLTKLVGADETARPGVMKEIVSSCYPFLFKDGIDLKRITLNQLQELFEKAGATGGTNKKSIAFFMEAAKSGKIELSPHIGKIKGVSDRGSSPKSKKIKGEKSPDVLTQNGDLIQIPAQNLPWQKLVLLKYPTFDPSWSDEVRAKWFEGMKELMAQIKELSEDK